MMEETRVAAPPRGPLFLFAVSFLSLFLELLLIRWIGAEIRIFAYFRNLTLISCFLGLGIGFNLKRFRLGPLFALFLATALAGLVHPRAELLGVSLRRISEYLAFPEYNIWYAPAESSLPVIIVGYAMLAVVVVILAAILAPFGQILGELYSASTNRVRDYSINLLGSLAGTWSFALLGYLQTSPRTWFLIGALLLAGLVRPWPKRTLLAIGAGLLLLFLTTDPASPDRQTFWSPYQKLQLLKMKMPFEDLEIPAYQIDINSVSYMLIMDLSEAQYQRYPTAFRREDGPYYTYDLPYRFHPRPRRVLIVGSGGGNDAAAALRNGASQVDAVEIDPVIARLGLLYHPEKPYQDPRMRLIIDDARSFFKKTRERYDLIVFALLDSHTLLSNFTNINLDSYVYTRESFEEAKAHLAYGGMVALSFFVQPVYPWIGDKLYALLQSVFQDPPLVLDNYSPEQIHGTGGMLFLAGDIEGLAKLLGQDPELTFRVRERVIPNEEFEERMLLEKVSLPTDDWPYLYLKQRQIPTLYYWLFLVMGLLTALAVLFLFPAGRIGSSHFLFLGAGFMLVEVHSISKAALLFGSTWIVNVVIISAILVMILLANLVVLRFRAEKMRWWYAGVLGSLLLAYLVPAERLLLGNYLVRGLLVGAFYSLPLFFAGVIFASSLQKVKGIEEAFAANLLGAALGGMLDSASFLFGLQAVIVIALFLYLASALALRRLPLLAPGALAASAGSGSS